MVCDLVVKMTNFLFCKIGSYDFSKKSPGDSPMNSALLGPGGFFQKILNIALMENLGFQEAFCKVNLFRTKYSILGL